jgi:hypothetical protein
LDTAQFFDRIGGPRGQNALVLRGLPLLAVALLAACGGGGEGEPVTTGARPTPTQTSTGIVTVTVPNTANVKPVPTGKPAFKIELTASAHTVRAGEPFRFTVHAVDANGKPAAGTAKMRVFLVNDPVDTLGFFPLQNGILTRTYRFSPLLKGKDVILQAEVEGAGGTQRANWPVHVT